MIGLALSLALPFSRSSGGDLTPGGSADVWLWEAGIGLQWETNINIPIE